MTRDEEKAVVIYRLKRNGKRIALVPDNRGSLYISRLDHDGIAAGGTGPFTRHGLRLLKELDAKGGIEWLKTPQTEYSCWHICCCDECCPPVMGGSSETSREGARVVPCGDEHLKHVRPELRGTFPTPERTA